jgi:peptide/nickel transport system substrate-binding protein
VQAAVIIVVIVAAVAAGAYMATSNLPKPGPTTTSQAVTNPDTIVEETIGQPDTLDPATDYETAGGAIIQNVYETLVFFNGAHADQVVPWLASSFDVSADGLTYTYHMRSGITFTDGTPVDANAVYFSLMRAMIMDDPDGPAWAMLQVARGGQNYSKQYNNAGPSVANATLYPNGYGDKYTKGELDDFIKVKPVEVLDPMTVAVHLERPYAGWSFVMAFSIAAIVSPTAFKQHWTAPTDGTPSIEGATAGDYHNELNPWPASNMAGTGPYTLKSWDKASQTVILARNENYWGGPQKRGLASVPNVIIKGIDDANTRVLDFKAGTSDLPLIPATGGLVFQFVDQKAWFGQGKLVPLSPDYSANPVCPPTTPIQGKCLWPAFSTFFMGFNQKIVGSDRKVQAFQPFSDVRVRQAFTLSFNRTAYIHDVQQDFSIPASQIIPPGMFGYDPTIQPTPYDPAKAKQLLIDAGKNPIKPENAFSPKSPQTVEISYNLGNTARETAATIIANTVNGMASDTGLYARVTGLAWPQFLANVRARQSNVFFLGWIVDYVDPDDFLVPFAHGTAGTFAIRMSYNNPDVTKLIDQQASITDKTQRLQVITQIEHMTNDDWAFLWLNYGTQFQLARSWIHERANASIASGVDNYNSAIYGFYFYELTKGGKMSPPANTTQPSFLGLLQLPAISSFILKKLF